MAFKSLVPVLYFENQQLWGSSGWPLWVQVPAQVTAEAPSRLPGDLPSVCRVYAGGSRGPPAAGPSPRCMFAESFSQSGLP